MVVVGGGPLVQIRPDNLRGGGGVRPTVFVLDNGYYYMCMCIMLLLISSKTRVRRRGIGFLVLWECKFSRGIRHSMPPPPNV